MGDTTGANQQASGAPAGKRKIMRTSKTKDVAVPQAALVAPINTYVLSPKYPFKPQPVYNILQQKIPEVFEKIYDYVFEDLAALCKFLNVDLLRAINALYWPSYKIVVVVQCLEKTENSSRGSVRYYWNPKYDGLVTYNHETDNYNILVTAAFFYYE